MNNVLIKLTLSFPMLDNTPNRNCTIYTKEAIERAFASSDHRMPILMQSGTNRDEDFAYLNTRVIGCTNPTYYFDYDDKNKVYNVTFTGLLFNMEPDIVINEMHDDEITDFEIRSVSIVD